MPGLFDSPGIDKRKKRQKKKESSNRCDYNIKNLLRGLLVIEKLMMEFESFQNQVDQNG